VLKKALLFLLPALAVLCLAGAILYNLPPVHERLSWRVENLRTEIWRKLHPPEEIVFIPQEQVAAAVEATLAAMTPNATALPDVAALTPTLLPLTTTPLPSPTVTPAPIPEKVVLEGLTHEYEKMNNCGPATLSMNLTYYGWQGDQIVIRSVLRPNDPRVDDKNVMPAELAGYAESQGFRALVRSAGDLLTIKRLVAAGIPVIIEKGFLPPKQQWMGHYELVTGYDDGRERFITQDSYIMADYPLPYAELAERWRDFNYLYLVVFPPERAAEVQAILGTQADETANFQFAAERAAAETEELSGRDLFFAWYNRGTSLVGLEDYVGAAAAYDQAFAVYAALPAEERPWRMLWYQIGPYPAYYHTGRYQDVINLAKTTIAVFDKPVLEESYYWRGLARQALGDQEGAIADLQRAAQLNPTSTGALDQLARLGVADP
jgi:hypothetical protein